MISSIRKLIREAVVEFFWPIIELRARARLRKLKVKPETADELMRHNKRLKDAGVRRMHFSWAPGADNLTAEERAQAINKWLDAREQGRFVRVNGIDDLV